MLVEPIVTGEIYADKDEIAGWAIANPAPDDECEAALVNALVLLRQAKPTDRSDKARYFAVTITDVEKVLAYFKTFVVDAEVQDATPNPS
jgi:hypothetical protein